MWNVIKWYQTCLFMLFLACNAPDDEGGGLVTVPLDELPGGCVITETLSPWKIELLLEDGTTMVVKNTEALRTMAYTGNTSDLRNEYRCRYEVRSVNTLKTGHASDINNVGFASQLQIDEWIFAMYHPNNYPDHFIVYNVRRKVWMRYDHSDEAVWLEGGGD